MSVKEVEIAIAQLSPKELAELMAWLEEYHAQMWDKQIEEDLEAGRLDALLAEVDAETQNTQSGQARKRYSVLFVTDVARRQPSLRARQTRTSN